MLDKLFNGYIYNTAETMQNSKKTLIDEKLVSDAIKQNEEKKDKNTTKPPEEQKVENALPEPTTESAYSQYVYLIKINKNQVVEILFVISTLLSGKRKSELQTKLLTFDFINRLNSLQKQIKWKPFNLPVFFKNNY